MSLYRALQLLSDTCERGGSELFNKLALKLSSIFFDFVSIDFQVLSENLNAIGKHFIERLFPIG